MNSGKIQDIEREINILLNDGMSCFDYSEAFYHGTLYAILLTAADKVRSNAEFGAGRPDIVALWHGEAFILELKRVSGTELESEKRQYNDKRLREVIDISLNVKLDEAERQIIDNDYEEGVLNEYPVVQEAVCYGIAFCKRRCMVRRVK